MVDPGKVITIYNNRRNFITSVPGGACKKRIYYIINSSCARQLKMLPTRCELLFPPFRGCFITYLTRGERQGKVPEGEEAMSQAV